MPNEAYVVLAALVGALISFLSQQSQIQAENRKQEREEKKERRERLREKLEGAHLLLSKVAAETSIPAIYEMAPARMSDAEYETHPRQSREDLRTLQMIADLYFPGLHDTVEKVASSTSEFWKNLEVLRSGQMPQAQRRVEELSSAIAGTLGEAKQGLRELAKSVTGGPAQAAE